jgi:hypothetical protein
MTIEDYLRAMETAFDGPRAGSRNAVLQYVFSGRQVGICHAVIEDGALRTGLGAHPAPTATVYVDFDLWMRILSYQDDALLALQDGRYRVEGNVEALMESDTWFRR